MKLTIKKLIQTIIFIITFLLILLVDFGIYANIDKIIPTHQNEIYTFENKIKQEKYNFMYEMAIQIEETGNYKRVLDNSTIIEQNNIILNIIKNYMVPEFAENEIIYAYPLYEGNLSNTIYGDLKYIVSREYFKWIKEAYINFYIIYSEDMKKICYYNFDNDRSIEPNDYSVKIKSGIQASIGYEEQNYVQEYDGEDKTPTEVTKNKDELINRVKDEFNKINLNLEIKPNAIIKKSDFYILQDEENQVTIYYDNENNKIFGFYMGFEE